MKFSCFAMISNNTLSATDCIMNHDRAISANRVLIPIEKINKMRNVIQGLY